MDALWTLPELVAEVAARIAALPAPKNGQVRAVPDERTVRYYGTLGLLDRPAAMRGRTALYGKKHAAQVVAIKRLQSQGRSLSEIHALWPTLDDATLARMSGVELPASVKPPARAEFWKREPAAASPPAMPGGSISSPVPVAPPAVPGGSSSSPAGPPARSGFWKREPALGALPLAMPSGPSEAPETAPAAPPHATPGGSSAAPGSTPAAPSQGKPGGSSAAPVAAGSAVELRIELAPHVVLSLSVTDESVVISPADVRALRAASAPLLTELASRRLASHAQGEEP